MSHEKLNRAPLPHTIPMAIFALIVGINKYIAQDILPPLQGCVNDATLFKSFLDIYCTQNGFDLQVKVLLNEDATRSGILDTFTAHLLNNPAIPNGGHTPMIFSSRGMEAVIETICPHDEHAIVNGKYVHGIPDYVLGALLLNLAYTKGDNITVILDSCHSSGIARAELPDSGTARSPIYPPCPSLPILIATSSFRPGGYPSGGASVLSLRRPCGLRLPGIRSSSTWGSIAGVVAGTDIRSLRREVRRVRIGHSPRCSCKMHESVLVRWILGKLLPMTAGRPASVNNPRLRYVLHSRRTFLLRPRFFLPNLRVPGSTTDTSSSQLEDAHVVLHPMTRVALLIVERRAPAMQLDGVVDVHIPLNANHDNLPNILNEIAHFNHFLFHTNDVPGLRLLGGRCELRMFRLIGERPGRKQDPDFADFVQMDKESETLVAHIPSEMGVKYGFEIVNNSHAEGLCVSILL
ncbi:hypothetical protein FB45DRAFT_1097727 [Roridomyces roridus]|uniref:Peptidase C14 caspase domain-containing protein n=1 Tax=Roridomyces roridus TaxID=1738132 RepID=A0AAD7BFD7_9AGAR|nr:hypothetical protein FB45DRAFT_1097727 [Roridomyces roridus]